MKNAIEMSSADFKSAVLKAKKGCGKIGAFIRIQSDEGRISFTGASSRMVAKAYVTPEEYGEIDIRVSPDVLSGVASSLAGDSVRLAPGKMHLAISSGGARIRVPGAEETVDYAGKRDSESFSTGTISLDFIRGVSHATMPNCPSNPLKESIHLQFGDGVAKATATDAYRIALRGQGKPDFGVIIDATDAKKACEMFREEAEIRISDRRRYIVISDGDVKVILRTLDRSYFNLGAYLSEREAGPEGYVERESLLKSLRACLVMDSKAIIEISDGAFRMEARSELGEISNAVEMENITDAGTTGRTCMNVKYLIEALSAMKSERVRISLGKKKREPMYIDATGETEILLPIQVLSLS